MRLWSRCLACPETSSQTNRSCGLQSVILNDAETENVHRLAALAASFNDGRELLPKSLLFAEIREALDDPSHVRDIGISHALPLHSR